MSSRCGWISTRTPSPSGSGRGGVFFAAPRERRRARNSRRRSALCASWRKGQGKPRKLLDAERHFVNACRKRNTCVSCLVGDTRQAHTFTFAEARRRADEAPVAVFVASLCRLQTVGSDFEMREVCADRRMLNKIPLANCCDWFWVVYECLPKRTVKEWTKSS